MGKRVLSYPFPTERDRERCVGERTWERGWDVRCSLPGCRRLVLALLHAEKGRRPFSACNTGNRIRLHAGKSSTNLSMESWHFQNGAGKSYGSRHYFSRDYGIIVSWFGKLQKIWTVIWTDQRAKKVVSDSPGLVDFAIGLVNSVLNLPDG